jgi:hypothetical protein
MDDDYGIPPETKQALDSITDGDRVRITYDFNPTPKTIEGIARIQNGEIHLRPYGRPRGFKQRFANWYHGGHIDLELVSDVEILR